jgi:hypothetical protein
MRRAVAQFDGLLSHGGNRKTPQIAFKMLLLDALGGPSNLAGGTLVTTRRLILPLTLAVLAASAMPVRAQSAFPAPLPGAVGPPANDPAFPPVNGVPRGGASGGFPSSGAPPISGGFAPPGGGPQAAGPSDECMNGFLPLRAEAEKRGGLIKKASEHHAPPAEACKLIGNFSQSEVKMIQYIEAHQQKCGIPPQIGDQMRSGHKNTEKMLTQVCNVAQQAQQRGPAGPSLSEVLGTASAPEATVAKRSGGSTFDTLSGNVLAR